MITNAFKNSRSEYTLGCPRPRLVGSGGIGKRSTNWTNVTSNESWDTIGEPPILVVVDYHNDRSKPSLEQPSSEPFLFMTRPQLGTYLIIGLFGIIIAIFINFFLRSSAFDFIISIIGVIIFTGLTAYDTQKIARLAADPRIEGE